MRVAWLHPHELAALRRTPGGIEKLHSEGAELSGSYRGAASQRGIDQLARGGLQRIALVWFERCFQQCAAVVEDHVQRAVVDIDGGMPLRSEDPVTFDGWGTASDRAGA